MNLFICESNKNTHIYGKRQSVGDWRSDRRSKRRRGWGGLSCNEFINPHLHLTQEVVLVFFLLLVFVFFFDFFFFFVFVQLCLLFTAYFNGNDTALYLVRVQDELKPAKYIKTFLNVIRFLTKSSWQFASLVVFFHESGWSKQINIWATFIFFYTTTILDRMMVLNPCQKFSRGALWLQICS